MSEWYPPYFPFTVRHRLAEYFVGDLPEVVDVGTYKQELNVKGRLWSIDYLNTVSGFNGSVFEFMALYPPRGQYGVVCLGFGFEGDQTEADALVELCHGSEVLVLEWATDYEHPVIDPSYLVKSKGLLFQSYLDFPTQNGAGYRTFQAWA